MAQESLAWMLSKPYITAPIVGATSVEHIEEAVAALDMKLDEDEIEALEAPYVPHSLAGVMAQNKPANAKEKHVWSTGNQKI